MVAGGLLVVLNSCKNLIHMNIEKLFKESQLLLKNMAAAIQALSMAFSCLLATKPCQIKLWSSILPKIDYKVQTPIFLINIKLQKINNYLFTFMAS